MGYRATGLILQCGILMMQRMLITFNHARTADHDLKVSTEWPGIENP